MTPLTLTPTEPNLKKKKKKNSLIALEIKFFILRVKRHVAVFTVPHPPPVSISNGFHIIC